MRTRAAVLAVLLLLLVGTNVLAAGLLWRIGTISPSASEQLRNKINREHARVCDGRALVYDGRLAAAAKYKALDMGYRDYFAHQNPQGDRVWDGYDEAGIGWSLAAEIIAWNNSGDPAARAFDQFMDSAEHRRAIRHCGYRRFGVGSFQTVGRKLFAVEFIVP